VEGLEFWSEDKRHGLQLPEKCVRIVLQECRLARGRESGGILLGYYTDQLDCAVVTRVTGPGRGSRAGGTWFERGVAGLQAVVTRLWRSGRGYYLGEWHFHPDASADPSPDDLQTLRRIACDRGSQCRHPALLILGGDPATSWTASAYVFRRDTAARLVTTIHAGDGDKTSRVVGRLRAATSG